VVTLTQVYGVGAEHFPHFVRRLIEALPNPGCINSGLYLLYNGCEGMTSLVRRARCPVGIAVVDES
jgi:hypothetical protein